MKKTSSKYLFITIISLILFTNIEGKDIPQERVESKISVVVIDPGHGGKDWGTSIGNTREKNVVLAIAKKLGNTIKTNYPDIKIVYTRSKDVFIPLHERANIANKNEANLFISIHANGVEQKWVQGTETFVLGQHRSKENLDVAKKENAVILLEDNFHTTYEGFDPNSPESYIMFELVQDEYLEQSVMFASDIQNQFKEHAKRVDRSVKMAGFLVLRRTTMPGVLIETGFLSHPSERNYLLSESGKNKIASSIFRAFKEYKMKIEDKSSFNLITESNSISSPANKAIQTNETESSVAVAEDNNIYLSVQIMALKKELELTPENFKGEKNIFTIKSKNINRYYCGKFYSLEEAEAEIKRIQKKYPSGYIVALENGKPISIKKALGKM